MQINKNIKQDKKLKRKSKKEIKYTSKNIEELKWNYCTLNSKRPINRIIHYTKYRKSGGWINSEQIICNLQRKQLMNRWNHPVNPSINHMHALMEFAAHNLERILYTYIHTKIGEK